MQHLPFKHERLTPEEIEVVVNQLITQSIIPEDAKMDIQFEDIYSFVESDLYLTIATREHIYRELHVVCNQINVDQLEDDETDASIIQGMIDLIFIKNHQYYFVDYKTDAFNRRLSMSDDEVGNQLRSRYKIQMEYYRNTLQTILN